MTDRAASVDVVCLGETMALLAFEATGPLRIGATATLSIGGAESNVAIGLARLGHRVGWIGRVGDDAAGQLITATLHGEGVDVSTVTSDGLMPTGLMLREHRTYDRFRVDYYRRGLAGSRLAPEQVDDEFVRSSGIAHITGISAALSDSAGAAALRAIDLVHQSGGLASFDVNHRSALWSTDAARPVLREFVRRCDVVFAGPDEAELVLDLAAGECDTPALVAGLLELGPGEVVVKCGADGAIGQVAGGEPVAVAPRRVTCLDPVGAGDAFVAGHLSGLLDGLDLAGRLDRGNACGAFAVSVHGDWEGAPRRDELGYVAGGLDVLR